MFCVDWVRMQAQRLAHPMVNQIVFTGSVPTGIAIASAAAKNVVPCVLELGGKSAAIVHSDADLRPLKPIYVGASIPTQVSLFAMSRVIVHESRHAELIERAVKVASDLTVAPGETLKDMAQGMGSVSHGQRDRALVMVKEAQDRGATLAAGAVRQTMQAPF